MSSDTTADEQTNSAEKIIPQDTSTGVFDLAFNMTFGEWALVGGPPVLLAIVYIRFLTGLVPGRPAFFAVLGSGLVSFAIVLRTPDYISPRELAAREVGGVITQIRMPLVGEEARDVPGVVADHQEADAVERADGAQVAVVHVGTVNLSQADDAVEEGAALDLAARLDVNLSKTDTPAKVRIRRRHTADVSRQVEDLRDLDGDPSRGQVGFAADHANANARAAVEKGVMDVDVFAETWVHPDEVAGEADTTRLDRFASSSRVRPSPGLRAEQFEELHHRVQSVRAATQPAEGTPPAVLSADGVIQVLREYWTDVEADGEPSETIHAGAPVPESDQQATTDALLDALDLDAETRTADPQDADPGETAAADGGTEGVNPGGDGRKPGLLDRVRGLTETSAAASAFGPVDINAQRKRVDVNDHYTATFWVTGWPKYPDAGFLRPVMELPGVESDTVLFLGTADQTEKMNELGSRMDNAGFEGASDAEDGEDSSAGDAAQLAADLERLRDHMRDENVDASEVSAYVTLRARDQETLSEYRRSFRTAATEAGLSVEAATGASRQMAGLISTAPVGGDRLFSAMRGYLDRLASAGGLVSKLLGVRTGTRTRMDMPPGALGAMLPFNGGLRQDHDGVLFGLAVTKAENPRGMLQVARDKLSAPHRLLIGRTGSGKTFRETVMEIEELIRQPDRRAVFIDIAGNFDGIVELFGGEKVVLGETTVNPFSVAEGVDLDSHIRLLTDMFHLYLSHHMSGDSADDVRAEVQTAVSAAYERVGISDGSDAGKPSPTVADFRKALRDMSRNPAAYAGGGDGEDDEPTEGEKDRLRNHADAVLNATAQAFTEGGTYDHLVADSDDPDGAADLSERVVLYDMSKFKKSSGPEKGMLTLFVLSQALDLAAAAETDDLVDVVIDEAHDMLGDTGRADHVMKTLRVARNAGLALDLLTQASEDFVVDESDAIAQQCPVAIWGDMSDRGDDDAPRRHGWSPEQAATIKDGLAPGDKAGTDYSEAMVDVDGDKYRTQFRVGPVAEAVATYDADEDGPFDEYLEDALAEGAEAEAEWHELLDEAAAAEGVGA